MPVQINFWRFLAPQTCQNLGENKGIANGPSANHDGIASGLLQHGDGVAVGPVQGCGGGVSRARASPREDLRCGSGAVVNESGIKP